jgi:hypothetical protein
LSRLIYSEKKSPENNINPGVTSEDYIHLQMDEERLVTHTEGEENKMNFSFSENVEEVKVPEKTTKYY